MRRPVLYFPHSQGACMRRKLFAVVLSLGVALASNALAQTENENWKTCSNDSADPDLKIAACTAVVQSGQETAENAAVAYFHRGTAYDDKDQLDRAIEDYSEAIRIKPDYVDAYRSRGQAYGRTGHYDTAIADFDRAIKLDAKNVDAYSNRGFAYYYKGLYDRAIEDENRAIQLAPDDAVSYFVRGLAKQKLGDQIGGAADIARAKQLNPNVGK